jgi:GT2 family glycosyltransferase
VQLPEIEFLIFGNCINASFLYKKEVYERNEGYDESLFLVEDYDFWLRAFKHSKYKHLAQTLYRYRSHVNSLTSTIKYNNTKQKLFVENSKKMYTSFFTSYIANNEKMAEFFTNKLMSHYIDFNVVINYSKDFKILKSKLKLNINISDGNSIENIFLKQMIIIMVENQDLKSNISKCFFILKNYMFVLDKNNFKALVKFSFFK